MPTIVNVEDMEFEDLIPLLKENENITDYISEVCSFDDICNHLRIVFEKLQKGEPEEQSSIGYILIDVLTELGRFFIDIPGSKEDYIIYPIKKNELIRFINRLIHNEK